MYTEFTPRLTAEEQLAVRSDLFWQNVYNRLQWMGQPIQVVLGPELE